MSKAKENPLTGTDCVRIAIEARVSIPSVYRYKRGESMHEVTITAIEQSAKKLGLLKKLQAARGGK